MKITKDWVAVILYALTILLIVLFCKVVVQMAEAHGTAPIEQHQTSGPREIPHCDKELWLRIKDGCSVLGGQ